MGDKYIDEFDNIDDNLMGSSLFLMYSDCDTVNASLSAITAYVNGFGGAFTGNTSASCITELWVSNIHGCSPIIIHNSIKHNSSTVSNDTSFAFGDSVIATGTSSHAEGRRTKASGSYSHAEGSGTTASNTSSHAEGRYTTASGLYSHAEGSGTRAIGKSSHAEGANTIASGTTSHAEGSGTTASNIASHAEGYLTTAKGSGSHAEGQYTTAIGDSSHAEGETTTAIGFSSHAEGYFTTARGGASHAEGNGTTAFGNRSHAEGSGTTAIGFSSHAEGYGTIASGYTSHAEGSFTLARGNYSHTEGYLTTAKGSYSHAGGDTTIATGLGSFIHSSGSTVSGNRSVVLGGKNITGAINDTVYVPNLNINTTPANDNSLTNVLVRASDGAVKYRSISTSTTYGLYAQTQNSTPVSGTNLETSLISSGIGTLTVPANSFKVGDSFKGVLIGHLSCVDTATLHIRVKTSSGIPLADTGVMAMNLTTNKHWKLDVDFTVRTLGAPTVASIASGGLFAYTKNSGLNFEGVNFSIVNYTTFDTTVDNTLVVTAQWNTSNSSNSIFSEIFTLNKIY